MHYDSQLPVRFSAMSLHSDMVGRKVEMEALRSALDRAVTTRTPEVVTITGGAGVGKTRLVHEFLSEVRSQGPGVLAYRGASRAGGPSFGIMRRLLRARFGVLEGAKASSTAESLREMVSNLLGDRRVTEFVHFLGAYLDLEFPGSPFIRAFDDEPAQRQMVSRTILRRFFELDARRTPLVLSFEDLHWGTEDCLSLVKNLTETLSDAPILVIVVGRPELLSRRGDWMQGRARHGLLQLGPLDIDDAASMVAQLLAPVRELDEDLVDIAIDVSAGSPFLLEQMVRSYHENGTLVAEADGSWSVNLERLDQAVLPLSVNDAIFARVSSLSPAERALLECAATVGSVFWLGALVALARTGERPPELWGGADSRRLELSEILHRLEERDYILKMPDSSIPGESEYAFKHNLERETLLQLTAESLRVNTHRSVAEWLSFRLSEKREEHLEMLAYHYGAAGDATKAAEYYLRAGHRARERYANVKAAEYFTTGLEHAACADPRARMEGFHAYGDVLQRAGRNQEALQAFEAMLREAFLLDLRAKGGAAHNRIGRLYRAIGHLEDAMRHLGNGQALFEQAGDERGQAASLDDIGKVHWMRGDYETAERFLTQARDRRKSLGDARSLALSLNNLGLVYQDSGRFSEALTAFEEALVLRREKRDLPGICQTLNNLGTIHQDAGDHERAAALYQQALGVADEVGDRMRQAVILTNLGESHYRLGSPGEAIRVLTRAEGISETLGDRILEGEILRGLSKAQMLIGNLERARERVSASVELLRQAGGKPFLGVALRTQGEIFSRSAVNDEDMNLALGALRQSIKLFTELGNDLELRRSCEFLSALLDRLKPEEEEPSPELEKLRARLRALESLMSPSQQRALNELRAERIDTDPESTNPYARAELSDPGTDTTPE